MQKNKVAMPHKRHGNCIKLRIFTNSRLKYHGNNDVVIIKTTMPDAKNVLYLLKYLFAYELAKKLLMFDLFLLKG